VVKKIADEHGSRIDISNRVEDGKVSARKCRYHSRWQAPRRSRLQPDAGWSHRARDNIKIMANILVVDDELGIRDLLQEILNDEGHNVEVAENAAQARAARLRDRPDLVLLDIWMPDTDGVTLLKEWSTTGALTMPVIMMSGHATIDTAVEATKIGALAFLEKPITLQKLLKAVEQGLARTACASCLPTPARPGAVEAPSPPRPPCRRRAPGWTSARWPARASAWTSRCAKPATNSRKPTSNTTWPRKTAP
jgi:CheY-like chemotaxis protein